MNLYSKGNVLVDRGSKVDGISVPRALFGDDKIKAAVRDGRRLTDRVNELLAAIIRARFEEYPPNNRAVREAVKDLQALPIDLQNVFGDLRLFTEVTPDERLAHPGR